MKVHDKKSLGFTLIELLVVVTILGILATVVNLQLNPLELTSRTRDAQRIADLNNLKEVVNLTLQENNLNIKS